MFNPSTFSRVVAVLAAAAVAPVATPADNLLLNPAQSTERPKTPRCGIGHLSPPTG